MSTANDALLGTRLAGFELTRCVARNAMTSVFEGVRDDERAAIKICFPHAGARTERNQREEQAQRQVVHPCVARVLATDRTADGAFVLASQWIHGTSLEARLAHGPLAWSSALPIMRDVTRGLGEIHRARIVHRDLKPSNIILPTAGAPSAVIIDFGHALVVDDTRLTDGGLVLGSAYYMAPEQAQGLPLDQRADLYALGVVLYRMLTGVLPFDHASPAEVMRMHQRDPVPPLRGVPTGAEDLCLWLLAKDRTHRVPNAHVLRLTLDGLERSTARESV